MSAYKHGAFAEMGKSIEQVTPEGVATTPVYVGAAPLHQKADYSGLINKPVLIRSYAEFVSKFGWSYDFATFGLCEAAYSHFANKIQAIGPIVIINVFDPAVKVAAEATTASVTIANGQGAINDALCALSTISISDKVLGTDYTVSYLSDGTGVTIKALTTLASPVSVSYKQAQPEALSAADIIGSVTNEDKTGLEAIAYVYPELNLVPTDIGAPGWSKSPDIYGAMVRVAQKINGHWYAFVWADLPADETTKTIAQAVTKKAADGYTSELSSPCWPMVLSSGRLVHLSTVALAMQQLQDYLNDNVPSDTTSNTTADISGQARLGTDGAAVKLSFDQQEANVLNAAGIKTAVNWAGWRIWGGHTGAYSADGDVDPRSIFDSGIRMMLYIMNTFQETYGTVIDRKMNRSLVDTIVNGFNAWLDRLKSAGEILDGEIIFDQTENPTSDMVEGDFKFNVAVTTAPQAKSLTAVVSYTDAGLTALFGGEEE